MAWKVVETAPTRFEAELIAALLRDAGIPVRIAADDVGGWVPALLRLKGVRILVTADSLEDAEEVLRESPR